MPIKRIGSVIALKASDISEYEKVHREVWAEVLATLKRCNVRNYSIYRYENLLFSYMEYVGQDYETDMAAIAADPDTQRWWKVTAPMQIPVPEIIVGEWWHTIPEAFHMD
jgi:L-rhamnose mutarotase